MHLLLRDSPGRSCLGETGSRTVREGGVAIITLAGGSGSRLGYDRPKGTYILPTEKAPRKSLFQRQAEKVFSAGCKWIIMVSEETLSQTVEHFQQEILPEYDREVYLVVQEGVEALDAKTREVLLDGQNKPVKVANGNGSVFKALRNEKYILLGKDFVEEKDQSVISEMEGVKYFNVISVDNVLVRIADAEMVGFAEKNSLEIVSAGVPEISDRKMGSFVERDSRIEVVEYTDETDRGNPLTNSEERKIVNIANHLISKKYVEKIDPALIPYNEAIKKIPHKGNTNPSEPNGIKRELFIFDGFVWAESHGVVEYGWDAYEGLKNKTGPGDSVETCTDALDREWSTQSTNCTTGHS